MASQVGIIVGMASVELLFALATLPISAVNLHLIRRSPVIHVNLKAILLFQSCGIFVRAFCRSLICLHKIVLNPANPSASEALEPFHSIYFFCFHTRNFCAHVLIVERVMATRRVHTYEGARHMGLTFVWIPIICALAIYNMYGPSFSIPFKNILVSGILLLIGILEFLLFIWLYFFNKGIYVQYLNAKCGHNLSERYQLSENIRIGKQLVPVLVLHLWSVAMTMFSQSFNQFGPPQYYQYELAFANISGSFCGLMIEYTMIVCHPFLKRNFLALMKYAVNCCPKTSIEPSEEVGNGGGGQQIALQNLIDGQQMGRRGSGNENGGQMLAYFAILERSWNK